jgi:hypothetical protein
MTIFEKIEDYVLMTPEEPYDLNRYKIALREAAEFCERNGLRKILADVTKSRDTIPVVDRFQLGIEMANVLGSKIQMAILAPPLMIDKLGENSAVNRGGRVFVTSSREQALAWLKGN